MEKRIRRYKRKYVENIKSKVGEGRKERKVLTSKFGEVVERINISLEKGKEVKESRRRKENRTKGGKGKCRLKKGISHGLNEGRYTG